MFLSWSDEDQEAALEWADFQATLCSGCGHSRLESFDRRNEGRYDVEVLKCHACARKEKKAQELQPTEKGQSAPVGLYLIVTGPNDDG